MKVDENKDLYFPVICGGQAGDTVTTCGAFNGRAPPVAPYVVEDRPYHCSLDTATNNKTHGSAASGPGAVE